MPETAAGRDFAIDLRGHRRMYHDTLTDVQEANQNTLADEVIDAIEAEARALGRAEARQAVVEVRDGQRNVDRETHAYGEAGFYQATTQILAAIDNLETP